MNKFVLIMMSLFWGNYPDATQSHNELRNKILRELMTFEQKLPRSMFVEQSIDLDKINQYLQAVDSTNQDLHSIMVVRHGKVVYEKWFGQNSPEKPHIMNSVSKSFTATAVGFAVNENRLKLTDKVISFFPDKLPGVVSNNLREMRIYDLLTMSTGNKSEELYSLRNDSLNSDWVKAFLAAPVVNKPGCVFEYNSMATFMLSAIVQKVTGQKVIGYLTPRLFEPLGIVGAKWQESPEGINVGGWGLNIKTEDMAKFGQLFLQKGRWEGDQLIPESWINDASSYQVASFPSGTNESNVSEIQREGDWTQGYGYQMWRCNNNAYRADGANGQFIIVIPDKDAVIVTTANVPDMQDELNLVWKFVLPALK